MQLNGERALFAGAHLDDIEFGCGGVVARFRNELDMRFLTLTKKTRASTGEVQIVRDVDEPYRAAEALGITAEQLAIEDLDGQLLQGQAQQVREVFLRWRRDFDPHIIIVPARDDIHQDHHVVYEEAVRIFRDRTVVGFEVVRSTLSFRPNLFVGIEEEHLEKKIEAVMAYQSQLNPNQSAGYYFKPEIIRGQATFRGGQSNKELAEAFEIYLMHF
jgi:LmbE family N-acetylglucosaminyl deacetylase